MSNEGPPSLGSELPSSAKKLNAPEDQAPYEQELQDWVRSEYRRKLPQLFAEMKKTKQVPSDLAEYDMVSFAYTSQYWGNDMRLIERVAMEEIVSFFESHDGTEDDNDLKNFAAAIKQALFSSSDPLGAALPIEQEFSLLLRAGRVPSLQSSVAPALGGDVVYKLSFDHRGVLARKIEQMISGQNPASKIDSIQQLITIGARASGWGPWSRPGAGAVWRIVEGLAKTEKLPLVQYVIQDVLERLEQERLNPSIGAIERVRNEHYGRVSEKFSEEEIERGQRILAGIIPNIRMERGGVDFVAKNTIVYLDHSKLPQRIARVPAERVLEPRLFSGSHLHNLASDLEQLVEREDYSIRTIEHVISVCEKLLVDPQFPARGGTSPQSSIGNVWHEISPILSPEEWEQFRGLSANLDDIERQITQFRQQKMYEASERNARASAECFAKVFDLLPVLREEAKSMGPAFAKLLNEFEEAYDNDEPDEAFDAVAKMDSLGRVLSGRVPTTFLMVGDLFKKLQKSHRRSWKVGEEEERAFEVDPAYRNLVQDSGTLLEKVAENGANFYEDVSRYVSSRLHDPTSGYVPATFVQYRHAVEDLALDPLHKKDTNDSALLLRVLHGPGVREHLEKDFHLEFKELPLRAQFHFLRFLTESSPEYAERLKKLTNRYPDAGNDIATAFLSFAAGTEYGEKVLVLAEELPPAQAKVFFALCREVADLSDDLEVYLQQHFDVPLSQTEPVAAMLLKNFVAHLDRNYNALRKGDSEALELLTHYNADQAMFVSAFKALRGSAGIKFEQVRQMSFTRQRGIDIPRELRQASCELYKKSHASEPAAYREALLQKHKHTLDNPNSYFYLLQYKGQLVGMTGFTEECDEQGNLVCLRGGSFNIDPDFRGVEMGEVFLETAFKQALKRGVPIKGYIRLDSPLLARQLAEGFVADCVESLNNVPRARVTLLPDYQKQFVTKNRVDFPDDVIIERAEHGQRDGKILFTKYPTREVEIPEGFALTRLIQKEGHYYAVFEEFSDVSA